jgi:hypothetical protein
MACAPFAPSPSSGALPKLWLSARWPAACSSAPINPHHACCRTSEPRLPHAVGPPHPAGAVPQSYCIGTEDSARPVEDFKTLQVRMLHSWPQPATQGAARTAKGHLASPFLPLTARAAACQSARLLAGNDITLLQLTRDATTAGLRSSSRASSSRGHGPLQSRGEHSRTRARSAGGARGNDKDPAGVGWGTRFLQGRGRGCCLPQFKAFYSERSFCGLGHQGVKQLSRHVKVFSICAPT